MRLEDENDPELLRHGGAPLEAREPAARQKIVELTRELVTLKGGGAEQIKLRIAELEQQIAKRNRMLFGEKSERRAATNERARHRAAGAAETAAKRGTGQSRSLRCRWSMSCTNTTRRIKMCPSCGGNLEEWDRAIRAVRGGRRRRAALRREEAQAAEVSLSLRRVHRDGAGAFEALRWSPVFGRLSRSRWPSRNTWTSTPARASGAEDGAWKGSTSSRRRCGTRSSESRGCSRPATRRSCDTFSGRACWAPTRRGGRCSARKRHLDAMVRLGDHDARRGGLQHPGRSLGGDGPQSARRLQGHRGVRRLQRLQVARQENPALSLAHCWAHVRREYIAAEQSSPDEAKTVLGLIRGLYEVEALCPKGPEGDAMRRPCERSAQRRSSSELKAFAMTTPSCRRARSTRRSSTWRGCGAGSCDSSRIREFRWTTTQPKARAARGGGRAKEPLRVALEARDRGRSALLFVDREREALRDRSEGIPPHSDDGCIARRADSFAARGRGAGISPANYQSGGGSALIWWCDEGRGASCDNVCVRRTIAPRGREGGARADIT